MDTAFFWKCFLWEPSVYACEPVLLFQGPAFQWYKYIQESEWQLLIVTVCYAFQMKKWYELNFSHPQEISS